MNPSERALLGIATVVAAVVITVAITAETLFGFDISVTKPFALLASEPFTWIVVTVLFIAVLGHAYLD